MSATTTKSAELELKLKRMAVLASIKNKKNNTFVVATASISKPPRDVGVHALYDSVLDLRSLGYSFDRIVELSGVRRVFLAECYKIWNFPVPVDTPALPKPRSNHISRSNDHTQARPSPVPRQRPMFTNNKSYNKQIERPEWLNNLVIDLESSDEEDEDFSGTDEEDNYDDVVETESENDSIVVLESDEVAQIEKLQNTKKRSFSNVDRDSDNLDLEEVQKRKKILNEEINGLSHKMKQFEKRSPNIENTISVEEDKIKQNMSKIILLKEKVETLEAEILESEDLVKRLNHEKEESQKLKESLSNGLIELEEVEKTEKKVLESIEQTKNKLRAQLMNQKKAQRPKGRETKEQEIKETPITGGSIIDKNNDIASRSPSPSEPSPITYDETIHKIPKAQQEHFTTYKSFGFKKTTIVQTDQDDCLCPFDLNGKCDDPECKFKHLIRT